MPMVPRATHAEGHPAAAHRGTSAAVSNRLLIVCAMATVGACGPIRDDDAAVRDADSGIVEAFVSAPVTLRFEPGTDTTIAFGDVPWPSDLYLDDGGRIAVGSLPGSGSALSLQLGEAIADLDGFGAMGPIYFYFDGPVDPASLPADGEASMGDQSSVFVIDVDANSPQAFERVPVETHWHADTAQLAVTPARGHTLAPGRRYAAVVTNALLDTDGEAVGPSEAFATARHTEALDRPERMLKAQASFSPVLSELEQQGLSRRDVIGLAVFRVQGVKHTLEEARALIRAQAPAFTVFDVRTDLDAVLGVPDMDVAGLDLAGGVLHSGLGGMVSGRFSSNNFLSETPELHGRFERDEQGDLIIKRVEEVPFTIWMPPAPLQVGSIPVVIFVHDLQGDRSDSVVTANRLAAAGYAVFAMDLPFHGSRIARPDELNRFTGAEMPDGFGDGHGDFAGRFEDAAELLPLHPAFYRGAMRQAIVDLMACIYMFEAGDFSEFFDGTEYAGWTFDTQRIGLIGVGVGGELGLVTATHEQSLGAVEALFPGGHITDAWANSAARQSMFSELTQALGIGSSQSGDDYPAVLWPAMSLYQTLLDAGDPQVLVTDLRGMTTNVLIVMARDDEVVPNRSTEALAFAIGAQFVNATAVHVRGLQSIAADGAVSGNFNIGDAAVTRVLVAADPATHDALVHRVGVRMYATSSDPPFAELDEPRLVSNPLDELLEQSVAFFDTWRTCATGNAAAACPASVMLLD